MTGHCEQQFCQNQLRLGRKMHRMMMKRKNGRLKIKKIRKNPFSPSTPFFTSTALPAIFDVPPSISPSIFASHYHTDVVSQATPSYWILVQAPI
ncbi:hypothetical protein IHE45_15G042300 [Dioscorea alata]|nr:hypothetical protein IHE45_15G042300 [Dioscorea alata]